MLPFHAVKQHDGTCGADNGREFVLCDGSANHFYPLVLWVRGEGEGMERGGGGGGRQRHLRRHQTI